MKFCNLFYILCNLIYTSCAFNHATAVQTSVSSTNDETNDIVISYENECRALCESCDCNGFFCGDNECICECKANINALNNYAQCLKDIIKDNLYKYNISVQHLNDPSNDVKKLKDSRKADNISKTIKKRSVSWAMHPEGTNFKKEKVFMAEDFKSKLRTFDLVGNPLDALKGLGALNLGKTPVVGAAVPSILAAPSQDSVAAAPALDVAAAAPDVAAAAPDVAAAAPAVAAAALDVAAAAAAPAVAAAAPDVAAAAPAVAVAAPAVAAAAPAVAAAAPAVAATDVAAPAPIVSAKSDAGSPLVAAEQDVGTAAIAALKAAKLGALAGIIGKLKAIKLPVVKAKVVGDAKVAAPVPITQPLETI